jgi:lipoprotein-releasing system permease protein
MTVIEKRSDIALIKALGGTKSDIQNIYLSEGLIIGLIATFLGTALGLGLCYGQIYFHWFQLDPSKFLIPAIPVSVYTSDIIIAVLLSLVLSVFAAILPARRAADTNITEALRNE